MSRISLILSTLLVGLGPTTAVAGETSPSDWARSEVERQLVKPLAEQRSSFSRRRPPPRESRVRVLQEAAATDSQNRAFLPFAVDIRYGDEWREDITGCVYREGSKIFVKRGNEYRPAAYLLGENVEPVAGVCEPALPKS